MTKYVVKVERLVPDEDLHPDDQDEGPVGSYEIEADTEEAAMDLFHLAHPIRVLDDHRIKVRPLICETCGKTIPDNPLCPACGREMKRDVLDHEKCFCGCCWSRCPGHTTEERQANEAQYCTC